MARIAVLDANVLWPQYLRDFLTRAAIFDMYRAAWTDRIIEEMRKSLGTISSTRYHQLTTTTTD